MNLYLHLNLDLSLLVIFVCLLSEFHSWCQACDAGIYDYHFPCGPPMLYKKKGEKCIRKTNRPATWEEASTSCKQDGGQLLTMNSRDDAGTRYLRTYGRRVSYWIGLNDLKNEGKFWWNFNKRAVFSDSRGNFAHWARDQPDNEGGNEDCVSMDPSGQWRDDNCLRKFRYLCERHDAYRPPPPELQVNFIKEPNVIMANRIITAQCSGFVGKGGEYEWYLKKGSASKLISSPRNTHFRTNYQTSFHWCRIRGVSDLELTTTPDMDGWRLRCCLHVTGRLARMVSVSCADGPVMELLRGGKKPRLTIEYHKGVPNVYAGQQVEGKCEGLVGSSRRLHLHLQGRQLEGKWVAADEDRVIDETFYDKMVVSVGPKEETVQGLQMSVFFKLNITGHTQGAVISCSTEGLDEGEFNTDKSRPLHVIYPPKLPVMNIFYHGAMNEVRLGDVMVANCSGHVGTGGSLLWVLRSQVYHVKMWQLNLTGPFELHDKATCVMITYTVGNTMEHGPKVISTFRLRVSMATQGADLSCFSYDFRKPKDKRFDSVLGVTSMHLNVKSIPKRPWLLLRKSPSGPLIYIYKPLQGMCTAALGTPGLLYVTAKQTDEHQRWVIADNGLRLPDMPVERGRVSSYHSFREEAEKRERTAIFRICATSNLEGERIACSTKAMEPSQFHLDESSEIEITYLPVEPRLTVNYHRLPNILSEGQIVQAKCQAFVGSNGVLIWVLNTLSSRPYTWKMPWVGPYHIRNVRRCLFITSKLDKSLRYGPSITSTFQMVVTRKFQGATLACHSCDTTRKKLFTILGGKQMVAASERLQVTHLARRPSITFNFTGNPSNPTSVKVKCSAYVGNGGRLSWKLTSQRETHVWSVDLTGRHWERAGLEDLATSDLDIDIEMVTSKENPIFGPKIVSTLTAILKPKLRSSTITCSSTDLVTLGSHSPGADDKLSVTSPLIDDSKSKPKEAASFPGISTVFTMLTICAGVLLLVTMFQEINMADTDVTMSENMATPEDGPEIRQSDDRSELSKQEVMDDTKDLDEKPSEETLASEANTTRSSAVTGISAVSSIFGGRPKIVVFKIPRTRANSGE